MDLISKAEALARRVRRQSLSKTVTYIRGDATVQIVAAQGETRAQSDNGELIINSNVVDWIFEAADLVLGESLVEPQAGDRIECGGVKFELMAIGSEKCWRWHGRDGQSFRVHTKVVS